ncbi:MAG: hypothetical protein KF708_05990 [Pirellulales bacterium]|nr:hypothetical protein [Pirellulales bacterium]
MKLNRTSAVAEYKLVSRFEKLRQELLAPQYADRLEKPLAFWALPADRRLPLAFMGCTIRELLETPFEELLATPGVGQKKINSLVKLLARVAKEDPNEEPATAAEEAVFDTAEVVVPVTGDSFNPNVVSEALWAHWRECVLQHGLGRETLGRFAPSLEHLPRVLWQTPLETYTDFSLAKIRQLKTHGEKRVAAVLEVFAELNKILGRLGPPGALSVRIVPRFVTELESWITGVLVRPGVPSDAEVEMRFIRPLVAQVRIDAGANIAELVESRLGLQGEDASVREVAEQLGLTRARIYQLLSDVGCMMSVRWPEGQKLVGRLVRKLHAEGHPGRALEQFEAAAELFFPGAHDVKVETDDEARTMPLPHDELFGEELNDPTNRLAG